MKKPALIFLLFSLLTFLFSCATTPQGPDDLDIAIRDTSDYLNDNIPAGNKIVILNIQSDYAALSDYIIDELIANAVNDRIFSVVDRAQLDLIRQEQGFQWSGEVDDTSALEIGRFLGAQTIVSGAISELGDRYRMRIRALNVQTAQVQGQYNRNIAASKLLTALMRGGRPSNTSYGTASGRARGGDSGGGTSGASGDSDTGGSRRTTPAQTQPARLPNGTYTFFPRPRANQAGINKNAYLDRIMVRNQYFTIYLTDKPVGEGNRPEGGWVGWYYGPEVLLQDLDRPSLAYKMLNGGYEREVNTSCYMTFENVTGRRFKLSVSIENPPIVFDEINIDDAEYKP